MSAQRQERVQTLIPQEAKETLTGKVITGATSLVPAIASGPAAPLTMAGMMGQSFQEDAKASGADEKQQTIAFYSGAAIGTLSEALLGMPALLRSAKAAGISDDAFRTITGAVATQVATPAMWRRMKSESPCKGIWISCTVLVAVSAEAS